MVPRESSKRVLVATLATAMLMLIAVEVRSPYYFLQDDNREFVLPAFVHNWRSLLSGEFPEYNFHTFAGIPHASSPLSAALYIPQYPALFLSQLIWGHPFAAMDLITILHALMAVAGGYFLLRQLKLGNLAASFGALTALSGFFLWCGQMWMVASALCAWFPWMVWASIRFIESPTFRGAGWLLFFRVGLLSIGYPQFFILGLLFEHLFALLYSVSFRHSDWLRRCILYGGLVAPTLLFGMPWLLPASDEIMRSLVRSEPLSYLEFSSMTMPMAAWIWGQVLIAFPLGLPVDSIPFSLPFLSHIGFIPTFLSAGLLELWRKHRNNRVLILASGTCFLLSLLWAANIIGPLIYQIPILNRFRWPFKLVYFAGFFQCVLAAVILQYWRERWQRIALAGFFIGWVWVFCFLPNHAWRIRDFRPPLRSPWREVLKDGRYFVISHSPVATVSTEFVELNFAKLWGLDNLLGYEPILPRANAELVFGQLIPRPDLQSGTYDGPGDQALLDRLKRLCVRYVLVGPDRADVSQKLIRAGFFQRKAERGWILWQDPTAFSRVHWSDAPSTPDSAAGIQWKENVNSIDVKLSEWPSQQLVFGFAATPGLETCIESRCTAVSSSPDGLVHMTIPAGAKHIRLVYHNSRFLPAFAISICSVLIWTLVALYPWRASFSVLPRYRLTSAG